MQSLKPKVLEMKALLAQVYGWTQGASARTAAGRIVEIFDSRAYSFCLLGANARVQMGLTREEKDRLDTALWAAVQAVDPDTEHIPAYNDKPGRTQTDILNVCDRAYNLVD